MSDSMPKQSQIDKFIFFPKGKSNRNTLLKALKFTVLQFSRELSSYKDDLKKQILFDFANGFGIYSPHLDINSAIIKIPNQAGFMIPHVVKEIREDPDLYLDKYIICGLLFKELYTD